MTYQVLLRQDADRELDKLTEPNRKAVVIAIISLQENPRPSGVKKLIDSVFWRIKVGKFRVIYSINDDKKVVLIVRVCKRNERTYENLWN